MNFIGWKCSISYTVIQYLVYDIQEFLQIEIWLRFVPSFWEVKYSTKSDRRRVPPTAVILAWFDFLSAVAELLCLILQGVIPLFSSTAIVSRGQTKWHLSLMHRSSSSRFHYSKNLVVILQPEGGARSGLLRC